MVRLSYAFSTADPDKTRELLTKLGMSEEAAANLAFANETPQLQCRPAKQSSVYRKLIVSGAIAAALAAERCGRRIRRIRRIIFGRNQQNIAVDFQLIGHADGS